MIGIVLKSVYRLPPFITTTLVRYSSKHKSTKLQQLLTKMPRDNKHVQEQQKARIKIREKNTKYIPGTVNLQILGSGAPGSPASVYLFTDQQRYLFNCGEGTQRLAHEHKTKLARFEHIFLTRNSWSRTGGLPGLCLTIQDAGVQNLSLHAPQGMDEIFKAMRRFVILKDLQVKAPVCNKDEFYEDSVLSVHYVPCTKRLESGGGSPISDAKVDDDFRPQEDTTDYYAHESGNVHPTSHSPTFTNNLPANKENTVMIYICKLKPKPGVLNLEKCVEKGVPPGPLLGQLKNGIDVTLPNGTLVKSSEVRGKDDPGPVFIVIDIPSDEYLDDFEANFNKFEPFWNESSEAENVAVVLHFTPNEIVESEIYQKFKNKFHSKTCHLLLNATNTFSGYTAAHRIQAQLNQINEHIFPLLKEECVELSSTSAAEVEAKRFKSNDGVENRNDADLLKPLEYTSTMTCYHLRPQHGLDRSIEHRLSIEEYVNESLAIPDFPKTLERIQDTVKSIYMLNEKKPTEYPKISFLGTGSCIPNKTRNVSGILIHTNKDSTIILDCGEGTTGQIIRLYGLENAREIIKNIKLIYISHLHADHHIGLIGLLQARRQILGPTADKVLLIAPQQISSWLYFYDHRIESLKNEYTLIPNGELLDTPLNMSKLSKLSISSMSTCIVRHCPHAFGVSFNVISQTQPTPCKITYSGDTMPCEELVTLGKDSTILIHEATMEDDLVYEARKKMHSTLSQALDQGRKMNAKYTILTHFSQRYAKLPRLDESILEQNVGLAFDNMSVTLFDLPHLHLLYPAFKLMFTEHWEEMEQKALKRSLKIQRELAEEENKGKINVLVA